MIHSESERKNISLLDLLHVYTHPTSNFRELTTGSEAIHAPSGNHNQRVNSLFSFID